MPLPGNPFYKRINDETRIHVDRTSKFTIKTLEQGVNYVQY